MNDVRTIERSNNLSACKKCGNNIIDLIQFQNNMWVAQCERCMSESEPFEIKEDAMDAWNEAQKVSFKDVRESSGMNKTQFSQYFNIPYRTIQGWESGERKCPEYVIDLMKYKLDNEKGKD